MSEEEHAWHYYEQVWEAVKDNLFIDMKHFVHDVLVAYEELSSERR